jgi:hypothetical protein
VSSLLFARVGFVLRTVLRYHQDMDSPVTLRLDKQTRERVARIARQNRVSASDVIREAIDVWLKNYEADARPYDSVSDLIGVVHGGNTKRSTQTGRQLTQLLKTRRKRV